MLYSNMSWWYYLLLPAISMAFLYAYVGLPEQDEIKKGNVEDIGWAAAYAVGIMSLAAGTVLVYVNDGLGLRYWSVMSIFVWCLVYYLMYYMPIKGIRLLHGGADLKCMLSLTILFPFYPVHGPIPFLPYLKMAIEAQPAIGFIIPFSFSVLLTAALLSAMMFLVLPAINLARRDIGGVKMFFGVKMDIRKAMRGHVWPMEHVDEDGSIGVTLFPNDDDKAKKDYNGLLKTGRDKVWVTPKIPFIVPIAIAFLLTILFGNILLEVVGAFTLSIP
jgi:archaeal preflagellin peptidase FlaK